MEALSLSTVMSDCSTFTVSPGLTRTSMTATSEKSPMSGTFTSTIAMMRAPPQAFSGLILSAGMPYCLMASCARLAGSLPCWASACSAATTT